MPVDRQKILGAMQAAAAREGANAQSMMTSLVAEALKGTWNEIDRLEKSFESLKASPLRYEGTWEMGRAYKAGSFVTHGGSLWHANHDTTAAPDGGPQWTLAVKRGRDGRDAQ